MKAVKVHVEKIIYGGWGLSRHEGKVMLIPGVLPEETVEIEPERDFGDYAFCSLKDIVHPSPYRTSPLCPHFLTCGGCDYQHIPYEYQVRIKHETFVEELVRMGRIPKTSCNEMIPAPSPFGWRLRLDIAVEVREKLKLGFYKRRTKEIVDIETCPVAHPLLLSIFHSFRTVLERHLTLAPFIKRIEITVSPDEEKGYVLIYCLIHHDKSRMRRLAEELVQECPVVKDVLIKNRALTFPHSLLGKGRTESALRLQLEGLTLLLYPGVFLQSNLEQNKALIRILKERLTKEIWGNCLELFCGMGNFSLPLASCCRNWTGIERDRFAVKNANYNASLNRLKVTFVCQEAIRALEEWQKGNKKVELLLLDPPRQGALEELKMALDLSPRQIVYISCNPATLARDIRFLMDNGFNLEEVIPIDFFPQSYHVESVSFLRRN